MRLQMLDRVRRPVHIVDMNGGNVRRGLGSIEHDERCGADPGCDDAWECMRGDQHDAVNLSIKK